jgi:hypothetical protein
MWKRRELVTLAFVEFVLELNPMQTQTVKEAFKDIHEHQHKHSDWSEYHEWYY